MTGSIVPGRGGDAPQHQPDSDAVAPHGTGGPRVYAFQLAPRTTVGKVLLGAGVLAVIALMLTVGVFLLAVAAGGAMLVGGAMVVRRALGRGSVGTRASVESSPELDPRLEVHPPAADARRLPPSGG